MEELNFRIAEAQRILREGKQAVDIVLTACPTELSTVTAFANWRPIATT